MNPTVTGDLDDLRRRLDQIETERRGLHDAAGEAALDAEQQTRWDQLDTEETALRDQITEAERLERVTESRARWSSTRVSTHTDPFDLDTLRVSPFAQSSEVAAQLRGRARTAIEAIRADDTARENMTRLLEQVDTDGTLSRRVIQTGAPGYEAAFRSYVAGRPLSGEESRALSLGVDAEGGFAVPVQLDPSVILTSDGSVNPLRQIARVQPITGKEWQGLTSDGVTASYAAEGATAGDNSPTLGQPTVKAERAHAFIPFTYEIGQDWGQLRTTMAQMIAEAKDDLEASKFINGAGATANEPEGVVAGLAASSRIESATANTFAPPDVYELDNQLPERFRARARFVANKVIYNGVRQFATADGHDLWARIGDGRPPQILGYPVHESSAMAADSTLAGAAILLLGDFRHYLIVDRVGMSVELIPHVFDPSTGRPTGQRGLYAFWRNSAVILADNAFRLLLVNDGVV